MRTDFKYYRTIPEQSEDFLLANFSRCANGSLDSFSSAHPFDLVLYLLRESNYG